MDFKHLNRAAEIVYRMCFWIGVLMAVGMTITVTSNIVGRYFFNYALSWAEEVARYMMVWMVMLGAAMGVRKGTHFRMEMIEHRVGPTTRERLVWAVRIVFAMVGVLMLWYGTILVRLTNYQYATATQMPMSWVYVSLPVSGLLMIFFVLERSLSRE